MFRRDGSLKPLAELDYDTAASVASIEADTDRSTVKARLWNKNAALEKAMRHLGLFERDNAQRGESVALQVIVVGPK